MVCGEEIDEFADGQRDGHRDGGGDEEKTYGEEERLFLGFGKGDDLAKRRAGAGGRKEGLREEAREKARSAVGGRRVRGEQASGTVRDDDGAGRAEVGGPWGTKKESRGDQHLRP